MGNQGKLCSELGEGGRGESKRPMHAIIAPEQFRVIHVTPTSWTIGAHEFSSYGWVIENGTNRLNPISPARKV